MTENITFLCILYVIGIYLFPNNIFVSTTDIPATENKRLDFNFLITVGEQSGVETEAEYVKIIIIIKYLRDGLKSICIRMMAM